MTSIASLPEESQLLETCHWLGLKPEFTELLVQALPKLKADPAVVERFDRDCQIYATDEKYDKFAPTEAEALSFYYLFIYLHFVPVIREKHRARHMPEEISRATLHDLDNWIRRYHEQHGVWGFDLINWSCVYFRSTLITLGRLGFEVTTFPGYCRVPEEAGGESILKKGDPVISVHIPNVGRLDPADCDRAFAMAREFFPCHFPEHHAKAFICVSWMMDRQLALYLPPESNLIHFLNRFQPGEQVGANDGPFWEFVFDLPRRPANLADAPRNTKLRRIILEHIDRGSEWKTALGYIPL